MDVLQPISGIPLLLTTTIKITVMFGVMYSVVLLLAVTTQSSALALISSYGLIFISLILAMHEQILPVLSQSGAAVFGALYHVLPNFIEVIAIMAQLAQSEAVNSLYPLLSSVLFGALCYVAAAVRFARRDF